MYWCSVYRKCELEGNGVYEWRRGRGRTSVELYYTIYWRVVLIRCVVRSFVDE